MEHFKNRGLSLHIKNIIDEFEESDGTLMITTRDDAELSPHIIDIGTASFLYNNKDDRDADYKILKERLDKV